MRKLIGRDLSETLTMALPDRTPSQPLTKPKLSMVAPAMTRLLAATVGRVRLSLEAPAMTRFSAAMGQTLSTEALATTPSMAAKVKIRSSGDMVPISLRAALATTLSNTYL